MEPEVTFGDDDLVNAYSRQAVEDFVAAADFERARLRSRISEAEARTRRARSAVGMHRVMVGMLLETHQDVARQRFDAEVAAAEIISRADATAEEILRAARADAGVPPESSPSLPTMVETSNGAAGTTTPFRRPAPDVFGSSRVAEVRANLDLSDLDRSPEPSRLDGTNGAGTSPAGAATTAAPDDERFFAYLRGALADEQPLGPRFD